MLSDSDKTYSLCGWVYLGAKVLVFYPIYLTFKLWTDYNDDNRKQMKLAYIFMIVESIICLVTLIALENSYN
jgi:hypothetical protein